MTGASGFIGKVILRELIKKNYLVMVLARNPELINLCSDHMQVVECKLDNIKSEAVSAIKEFAPESVIHCAWMGTENTDRNDTSFVYNNLKSSLDLLDITTKAGCRRWIAFGSQAEYSTGIDEDIAETAPTYPDTPYGIAKLATCHMLQALCKAQDISFVWLRIFASYGPAYKASYVMPYLLDCFSKQQMPILKTPHATWDYIHVDDVADATLAVLKKKSISGIFNLATGIGHSIGGIALNLAKINGFKDIAGLQKHIDSVNDMPNRRVANIDKIKRELSWTPQINLQEGLTTCQQN